MVSKGLELSRHFCEVCGTCRFSKQFDTLMDRVAVGLVGPGSECLGFDDEHSRDHEWGPSVCLWLTRDDFRRHGDSVQACYDSLPKSFNGVPPREESVGESGRVGVLEPAPF